MINHLTLSPLTVLVRTNQEDSVNYLRINADLSRPETVSDAALNAFYAELMAGLYDIECDPGSAADAWQEYGCNIVGIAEGHFNIATSGFYTVSSLCNYLQFAIDAEKPPRVEEPRSVAAVRAFAHAYGDCKPFTCEHCGRVYHDGGECTSDDYPGRVALISVFVGRHNTDVDYDAYLCVVEALRDVADIYSAVIDDYDKQNGVGSWDDHGCFIVGVGAGAISMAWRPAGLDDAEIAAVARDVLGGAK